MQESLDEADRASLRAAPSAALASFRRGVRKISAFTLRTSPSNQSLLPETQGGFRRESVRRSTLRRKRSSFNSVIGSGSIYGDLESISEMEQNVRHWNISVVIQK